MADDVLACVKLAFGPASTPTSYCTGKCHTTLLGSYVYVNTESYITMSFSIGVLLKHKQLCRVVLFRGAYRSTPGASEGAAE